MESILWLNPMRWLQAFSHFMWCWAMTMPLVRLGAAMPAILALATVMIVALLTFTSDSQWRRGLVSDELRIAKERGANNEVALLTRRLLLDTPHDLGLKFDAAVAGASGDSKELAKETLTRLAIKNRYGRAALWLLENEYSPIQWDQWDNLKRSEFGTLIQIAASDQPDNKQIGSYYADYLLVTGSHELALHEITKLISVQPARALQGAMILQQLGRESQALAMARDGLASLSKQGEEEPENVNLALIRSQFSLYLKQYKNAVEILNRTAKFSDDQRIRSGTAESLVLWSRDQATIVNPTERFAKQMTLLSKAVEIAPNHPLVINDLITTVLKCSNEQDPMVAELRDLLVQGVAPELAHFIQGTAAMMRDDVEEASLHLELAAKGLPSMPAVINNLAVALASRDDADLDRALKLVDTALKQSPEQLYFHETRAQILLKMNRFSDAIISFERALPSEALREQIHVGLSKAYGSLGQKELADQHLKLANAIRAKATSKIKGP